MALGPKGGNSPDPTDKRALSDEVFLREVDDAVRAGDAENFWKNYGRWLVAGAAALLIGLAGYTWWSSHQRGTVDRQGEQFVDALDKIGAGDEAGAAKILSSLKSSDSEAYRAMSEIVEANLAMEKGDVAKAAAQYGKVAADTKAPQIFRDLAVIRQTTAEFDTLAPQKVVDRLKPLAVPGNAWFGSAGEMTAIAYMKMGKENLAGPIFAQIAKQEDLPGTLRGRAQQMAGSLGIDTVQLDEKKDSASPAADDATKGKE